MRPITLSVLFFAELPRILQFAEGNRFCVAQIMQVVANELFRLDCMIHLGCKLIKT